MTEQPENPSIDTFLGRLASGDPTPGGGAVAGLCGALAAALTSMVANLTLGKKKYADVEDEMRALIGPMDRAIVNLKRLMQDDEIAFDGYMAAWRLPKGTEEEKTARKAAIRVATLAASDVPLLTLEACRDLLPFVRVAAEKGNKNAVSDAGIAALLITCGAKAAAMNVKINLAGLKGDDHAEVQRRLDDLSASTYEEAAAIEVMVDRALD